ncbi:MAG: hypothetical protein EP315_08980 [Gammaproteobacteria bacterium]|nr:MAG: hypothetical protein EP315_08980 [Gammaproteobacteria bacterium]
MTQLHVSKIHITLLVTVPHEALEMYLPSSADVVGESLTEAVLQNVREEGLGYFPPLDYFQSRGKLDDNLIDAAETIAWFACKLVREEVQRKMRPFFSTISFQSVQSTAFNMPGVRPSQPNAWHALVNHYTPNTVKMDIVATVLKKQEKPDGLANWAKQLFKRNLADVFDHMEVTQTAVM